MRQGQMIGLLIGAALLTTSACGGRREEPPPARDEPSAASDDQADEESDRPASATAGGTTTAQAAYTAVEVTNGGTLIGRVTWTGERPPMRAPIDTATSSRAKMTLVRATSSATFERWASSDGRG